MIDKHARLLCGEGVIPNWDANKFTSRVNQCEYTQRVGTTFKYECKEAELIVSRTVYSGEIRNDVLRLPYNMHGNAVGTKLLANIVSVAYKYGVKTISCNAACGDNYVGNVVWCKLGFDGYIYSASLPHEDISFLEKHEIVYTSNTIIGRRHERKTVNRYRKVYNAVRVSDVIDTFGMQYFANLALSWDAEFVVNKKSTSVLTLQRKLKEYGYDWNIGMVFQDDKIINLEEV